jgi:hypothetical protein
MNLGEITNEVHLILVTTHAWVNNRSLLFRSDHTSRPYLVIRITRFCLYTLFFCLILYAPLINKLCNNQQINTLHEWRDWLDSHFHPSSYLFYTRSDIRSFFENSETSHEFARPKGSGDEKIISIGCSRFWFSLPKCGMECSSWC